MALTLLMATIAIQAGRATTPPKAAPPPPPAPDVLLARADESVEAEKALNEGKLAPAKLLIIKPKNPAVACYGRLADESRLQLSKIRIVADVENLGRPESWSSADKEAMRSVMDSSPFRQGVRDYATNGYPMTAHFERIAGVSFVSKGQTYYVPLSSSPAGAAFQLPADDMRLANLPTKSPAALAGPHRSADSVACLVPKTTPEIQSLPLMQKGLQALASVESEARQALGRIAPAPAPAEEALTDAGTLKVLNELKSNFSTIGFATAQEAEDAFRSSSPREYAYIGAFVDTKTPDGSKSFGWSFLDL